MTGYEIGQWIRGLIKSDNIHEFYTCSEWLQLRKDVLKEYKFECQLHKARGLYKKANTVHHVQFLRNHPEMAMSKTYIFNGKEYKNLIPLCHDCHEEVHGYRQKEKKKPLTEERW